MIVFKDVVKRYEVKHGEDYLAVNGVNFTVELGECCCLLGPNGAGKTTSIMMLLGFLPISAGDIEVCGVSVTRDPAGARRHISFIPDEIALYRNLTGKQNLSFFGELLGKKEPPAFYEELGARVGLRPEALNRKLSAYSKGMKQRLAIGVSLLKEAPVFVLDEPTAGLDAVGIKELIELLRSLRKQQKAVLITTHDLLHVSGFATTVRFLNNGTIQQTLDEAQLKAVNLEETYIEMLRQGEAARDGAGAAG